MTTKTKTIAYLFHSIAAAVLLLSAQISLAASATWLLSPQDSAWENPNNWTPGGPPNGPSDVATFAQSSQRNVNISTSEEVNSIVFTSGSASFGFLTSPGYPGGQLIISGTGVTNNSTVLQSFFTDMGGQIIFNNSASAASAQMAIVNNGSDSQFPGGQIIFNDISSAAGAIISNGGARESHGVGGQTIFNDASTAANASIDNLGSRPAYR